MARVEPAQQRDYPRPVSRPRARSSRELNSSRELRSAREILRLALPAFAALVAQPLFTLVDAAIVGQLGTVSLAALGAAAQIFTTVTGLAVFLAYGTTAVTARLMGAGDRRSAIQRGAAGSYLGLALGGAASVIIWWWAPSLLSWIGTSGETAGQAVTYLRIVALAFPAALGATAAVGVLRGAGDTATTLWVTAGAVMVNAALCAWWVLGAGWGIAGSAWATLVAEILAATAYGLVIRRRAAALGASLRPVWGDITQAARSSVPLLWRTVALRAVFLLAVVVATRMGDAELAAYYVTLSVWFLLSMAMDSLAIAGQTLTGQHLGARAAGAAAATSRQLTRWGGGLGAALLVAVLALRDWIGTVYAPDPGLAAMISGALVVVALMQPLAGVVFVLDGVLLGAGDSVFLAWAQILALIAFAAAAALAWFAADVRWLGAGGGVSALWLALTVFMLARAVFFSARFASDRWMRLGA